MRRRLVLVSLLRRQASIAGHSRRPRRPRSETGRGSQGGQAVQGSGRRDNVVWLDELYDITARIKDSNILRVTQLTAEPIAAAPRRLTPPITLKGSFVGQQGDQALNDLIDAFRRDKYYSPEPPKVINRDFTLTVNVEADRRTNTQHALNHVAEPADNNTGFGGLGGFGDFQP